MGMLIFGKLKQKRNRVCNHEQPDMLRRVFNKQRYFSSHDNWLFTYDKSSIVFTIIRIEGQAAIA